MRVSMPARFVGNVEVPGYWGLYVVQSRDPNRLVYDGYFIAVKTEIFENDQYPITLSRPENNFYIDKVVGTDDPGGGNLIYFTGPTTTLTIEAIKDGKIWASFSGVDEDGYYTTEGKIEGLPMSDFEISY